jgi:uncharacterized membrane protein
MVFVIHCPPSLCRYRNKQFQNLCSSPSRIHIVYKYCRKSRSCNFRRIVVSMSLLSKENVSSSDHKSNSLSDQKQQNSVKVSEQVEDNSFLRKCIMILSFVGIIDTAYLTIGKLFLSPEVMCQTQGCMEVLQSPVASIFGIPISFFGFLAYSVVGLLAALPLVCRKSAAVKDTFEKLTKKIVLLLSLAMSVVSAFLMYILFFQIQSFCPYCVLSALLSGSIFVSSSFLHFSNAGWKKWLRNSIAVLLVLMSVTGGVLVAFGTVSMSFSNQIFDPPAISTHSDERMMKLAEKLRSKKARFYGAFWCEHCYRQKQMLGKEAFEKIEYIECAKNGRDSQYKLCRERDVPVSCI